jgi:hypothetical protein
MITLALVAALFSCTAEGGSIYATIETEQKIDVSTLDQTLTVLDILNVAAAPLPYFVAAGAVYDGTLPDTNNEVGWPHAGRDPIPVSPPARGALCLAMTYFPFNSLLYGGFFADGPGMGLYTSPTTSPSFTTPVTQMAGKQISLLQVANSTLFAVVATPGGGTTGFTYGLEFSTNGTNFNQATSSALVSLAGLPQITGVAYLSGTYFVASGSTMYEGPDPAHLDAVNIGNGSDLLEGLTVDNGYVFAPSNNGIVYYYNGVTWTNASTDDQLNSRPIIFLTVSTQVGADGPTYLVGADGAGFYYLNVADNSLSRYSDVTVTGLYAGSVRRILVDLPNSNTVFMGTAGTGLWRARFDPATGGSPSTWVHE